MKNFFVMLLLASVFACKQPTAPAATTPSPVDSKLLAFVLKPKQGMEKDFESNMKSFAAANFSGDNDYRVQRVYGGDNDGDYIMTLAKLTSWAYYDDTTRNTTAFWAAFDASVRPTLESMQLDLMIYRPDLSAMEQVTYADKNTVTTRIVKDDMITEFENLVKKIKPVWEELGYNIAVYKNATGNTSRYSIVRRHPKGWGEKDPQATNQLKEAFIKRYSTKEWSDYGKQLGSCLVSTHVQLQYFRKDLSNK